LDRGSSFDGRDRDLRTDSEVLLARVHGRLHQCGVTGPNPPQAIPLLGTPLLCTTYDDLATWSEKLSREPRTTVFDFSNTQIVTLRRHDREFREITSSVDYFIPDGMPLIWCLNALGAGLKDRVYGPTFMSRCLQKSPPETRHYFLGGSQECLNALLNRLKLINPGLNVAGSHHGYFKPADEAGIVDEINRLAPHFLWVGLGTPRQQYWIQKNRKRLNGGLILAVGFAFDVNAGTKRDAPFWIQRLGMTWFFRLCSEPRRLAGRYLRFNSLFLYYLLRDRVIPRN
jgi:N-acetylglucosaminyldiphosphoundecaprenol N-acetyl-beta-D-mannosaminyltransferase